MAHGNSTFKSEYTTILLDMFSEGASLVQYLAAIGKGKKTFYEWLDKRPDFAEAYELAKVRAEAYWEEQAHMNMNNPDFNFGHLKWLMGNRYGTSSRRKSRFHNQIKTTDLVGSFNRVVKLHKHGDMDTDELRQYVGVLLDLANLNEKDELEKRITELEEALKEQNEQA